VLLAVGLGDNILAEGRVGWGKLQDYRVNAYDLSVNTVGVKDRRFGFMGRGVSESTRVHLKSEGFWGGRIDCSDARCQGVLCPICFFVLFLDRGVWWCCLSLRGCGNWTVLSVRAGDGRVET